MTELGLLASIISVASAGAKISLCLYKFADAVGGAGRDVRGVATEISLFCSVLRQLDSTLRRAKATRYSLSTLMVAEEILGECQSVFAEIGGIIDRLQQGSALGEPSVNLVSKVRVSTTATDLEDEDQEILAESLLVTRQLMIENLRQAEEQEAKETLLVENMGPGETAQETREGDTGAGLSTDAIRSPNTRHPPRLAVPHASARIPAYQGWQLLSEAAHSGSRDSVDATQKLGQRFPVLPEVPTPPLQVAMGNLGAKEASGDPPGLHGKRASVWLSDMVFDREFSPITRRQTWGGDARPLEARQQLKHLLQKWIQVSSATTLNQELNSSFETHTTEAPKTSGTNSSQKRILNLNKPCPPPPQPSSNSTASNLSYQNGRDHFFSFSDLGHPEDPTYSDVSDSWNNRPTPSLARSSVATTIYSGNMAVDRIAQTMVRGRANMISVKLLPSSDPSPTPPIPISDYESKRQQKGDKEIGDATPLSPAFSIGSTFLAGDPRLKSVYRWDEIRGNERWKSRKS